MATGGYAEGKLTRKLSKEVDETGVSEEENYETHKELIKKLSESEDRPHEEGYLRRKLSAEEEENFETHKELIKKLSEVEDRPHVEGKLARKLSADVDPETGVSEVENFDTHKELIKKLSAEANLSAAA